MLAATPLAAEIRNVVWQRSDQFRLTIESLPIPVGSRVALIGGNGSGKSSLLELLAGISRPDSGELRLFDMTPDHHSLRRRIGVQTPLCSYNSVLKVGDFVDLHRRLHQRIDDAALDAFEVDQITDKLTAALSQGQRRRLDLHLAFAHAPDLLLLDEPTAGLDASRHGDFLRLCQSVADRDATILSATHDPAEVSAADRVVWFDQGEIRAVETPQALLEQTVGRFRAVLTYADPQAAMAAKALAPARDARIVQDGSTLEITGDNSAEHLFDRLSASSGPIRASRGAAMFDDLLLAITGRRPS